MKDGVPLELVNIKKLKKKQKSRFSMKKKYRIFALF
jgi:hypothetical protein